MRLGFLASCLACAAAGPCVHAAHVYVFSSGNTQADEAVMAALTAAGHTPMLGVQYTGFDGSINLAGFQTVYLQANANWSVAAGMPTTGQQQLVSWVHGGGRLVTSEWVTYFAAPGSKFEVLGPILPLTQAFTFGSLATDTYTQATPDAVIDAGMPASFAVALDNYGGTESYLQPKTGATVYYSMTNFSPGCALAGWAQGSGSVFSFSSTCGPDQVTDVHFERLLGNVMNATGRAVCYANCDGSTIAPILNVNDFICFQTKFAAGDTYANCDQSTTPPILNVNDFICFQSRFAAGCP